MSGSLGESLGRDAALAALFAPEAELLAMLRFEAALAEAQARLGAIPAEAAAAIAAAASGLRPDRERIGAALQRDGVAVPELVCQLRAATPQAHRAAVHHGATSQDVIDTALMLRLREALALIGGRLETVLANLKALDARFGPRPLMAQTRMQAALPFTAGAKIDTWTRPLAAHAERLAALAAGLPVQLGGPVGDGSSFGAAYPALRADLAARLGLRDAAPWHSDRTAIADVGHALTLLLGTLGKVGQDVALLAQSDRLAVRIEGAGGSSAMAHKQNPVAAEVLVALARFGAGLQGTLAQGLVHENERSGAAWTLEWLTLPPLAEAAGAALLHANRLLPSLSFQDPPNAEDRADGAPA